MQGIYTYIPETNHVPREHTVAAILSLLFMVPISPVPAFALLYFYVSTFRSIDKYIIIIIIIIIIIETGGDDSSGSDDISSSSDINVCVQLCIAI
jgi:hypothetical protein